MLENLGLVLRLVNLLCLGHARKNEVGCRDVTVLEGSGRIHPFEERTHAQDAQMMCIQRSSLMHFLHTFILATKVAQRSLHAQQAKLCTCRSCWGVGVFDTDRSKIPMRLDIIIQHK